MTERITVREACRRRIPIGTASAEALEHALTQVELENTNLLTRVTTLSEALEAEAKGTVCGPDCAGYIDRAGSRFCRGCEQRVKVALNGADPDAGSLPVPKAKCQAADSGSTPPAPTNLIPEVAW